MVERRRYQALNIGVMVSGAVACGCGTFVRFFLGERVDAREKFKVNKKSRFPLAHSGVVDGSHKRQVFQKKQRTHH